jgi:lantibiotic modifying enzyme
MCTHHPASSTSISRRDLLRAGAVALAAGVVLPRVAQAQVEDLTTLAAYAPQSDFDIALAAERWIRRARIETPDGVTWPADPLKPASIEYDLYNGMPGVVLFYLELYAATGDKAWLSEARAGSDELATHIAEMERTENAGLYTGLAGAAFVLEETFRATGDGRYRDAAMRAIDGIHDRALRVGRGSGATWSGESATNDIISGNAGIGLFLLWADQRLPDPRNRETAIAAGRHLLDSAIPERGGLKWNVSPNVKNLYPNFSHGAAGASYFLASLYQASGDRAFLNAALAGATYLETVANTDDDGLKVFHHEPGGESLYYLSWCHGPAGLSRLFYRLGEITSDERWHDRVRRAATATMAAGVPEQRTPGFWNNISQCCGNSGVGEYFLILNRVMPNPRYAAMVRRVADDNLRRATADGDGMKWVQAENRVSPDVVVAQTGFMQGAAGVGAFFLHAHAASSGARAPAIVWPDTPFV